MALAFNLTTRDVPLCTDAAITVIAAVVGKMVLTTTCINGTKRKTAAMAEIAVWSPRIESVVAT